MASQKTIKLTILIAALTGMVGADVAKAQSAPDSSGANTSPSTKGVKQPQGWTGPLETGSGGAPASSPQGQSPPNMQAAPEGSSKSIKSPGAAQ
jgi:hypothetical protein